MHDGAFGVGALQEAVSCQNEFLHALDVAAQLELAGMLHGAAHLHQIVEAGHILIGLHEVAVGQFERTHLEFLDGMYAVFRAHGALEADALGVGFAVEAAGIVEQVLHRL